MCNPVRRETAAHQAPPSLGFSRQEHWSGLPFPSPMHESEKKVKSLSRVQLSDPMDCRLPGASIHGIFQAEVLEWVATAFSSLAHYCLLIPSVHCLYLHNVQHSLVRLYIVSFTTHTHTHTHFCLEMRSQDSLCFLLIYIFSCTGSLLLGGLSLIAVSRGYSSLQCTGFSLQWLLLLQRTSSRHVGFSSCGPRA